MNGISKTEEFCTNLEFAFHVKMQVQIRVPNEITLPELLSENGVNKLY